MITSDIKTPLYAMNYEIDSNKIYIKRDDLLPFSFGGNKVRIAEQYFIDLIAKGYNCIISYGNKQSNLNRVIANMSKIKGIPCYIISPIEQDSVDLVTNNSKIVKYLGANIVLADKGSVAKTIQLVISECKNKGLKPYYIFGDIYGNGNEGVAAQAYIKVYEEIKQFERDNCIKFDYIFLPFGTGATYAGLLYGKINNKDCKKIIGVSIARNREKGKLEVYKYLTAILKNKTNSIDKKEINVTDSYILKGYGSYNNEINKTIAEVLFTDGIPLDSTYTGKAFWGMTEYLKANQIDNKNILFIHTGGLPLFFDDLNKEVK